VQVDSYEGTELPKRRPNTMNKFGLIVNEIGMEPILTRLVQALLSPLLRSLYPQELVTQALDHHHSFVVQYKQNGGNFFFKNSLLFS
jgi:hypothetical protein